MYSDPRSRRPRIGDRVYFVNQTRNTILHMYDNRGLDVIAPLIDDLRPIYETHRTWVLDYERRSIGEWFAGPE